MRGRSLICSMIEKRSDSDGEAEIRIADISTKSFIKRPALKDAAFIAISTFMNNAIFVKNRPGSVYMCDAAFLAVIKSKFRWMISGTSRVLYFVDKKLKYQSDMKEYPRIGLQPSYNPELGPIYNCEKGENAFFLCSKALTDAIGVEGIENALNKAASQDEWMRLVEEMAGDTDFAAQALIMPEKRKAPISRIIIIVMLAIVIALLLILIFK